MEKRSQSRFQIISNTVTFVSKNEKNFEKSTSVLFIRVINVTLRAQK
jgi:hypothetical protein